MNLHRKVIELMYEDTLTITEYEKVKDEKTKLTESKEIVVQDNIPCKLSYKSVVSTSQSDTSNELMQVAQIFLAPEIKIKPGSKITVHTKSGYEQSYKQSGVPAVYETHQEIMLDVFERWA